MDYPSLVETFLVEIYDKHGRQMYLDRDRNNMIGGMVAIHIARGSSYAIACRQLENQVRVHIQQQGDGHSCTKLKSRHFQMHAVAIHWSGTSNDAKVNADNWSSIWHMINKRGSMDKLKLYIEMECLPPHAIESVV